MGNGLEADPTLRTSSRYRPMCVGCARIVVCILFWIGAKIDLPPTFFSLQHGVSPIFVAKPSVVLRQMNYHASPSYADIVLTSC